MHIHFARVVALSAYGCYAYDECRCGARRTRRRGRGYTALREGWPVAGTGWQ